MPPLISFETGRKHKLNLLFKTTRWSETANGSLVLLKQEPRLRGQHTRRRIRKNLYTRSSEARWESFCPLDKDLSWKSDYRTCGFGGDFSCPVSALTRQLKKSLTNNQSGC